MDEILDEIEEFQSEKLDSFIEQCDLTDGEIPQKFGMYYPYNNYYTNIKTFFLKKKVHLLLIIRFFFRKYTGYPYNR